ncbi:hypothetical protein EDC55_12329 [Allofrancisella inopinata]|uniref:Uncharacterized protein n=1 Tax=Allofrancisella inopinata TaxID=1085647 RepID=A0AAE6YGT1_9GAMM|nr:hypothetical protein [Allofrancisella inopinata]QIV95650.1 hypothetical protein E4K63_01910 [Allofrancisella inopinata]TDT67479.1 hypothetical protein EDC55_12329 [Allofrancisella inopinata]
MTEFKENYNLYKDFTEKYKEGARKIFPTGLFQDDKYIGHEGLCEVQKKENEQKLKKFSSYFKENEYPQQYWEDQSKVVALNALKNTSLGFTISRDPLRAASNFVSNLYNISTFRPPDNVSGDLAKIDESYKELYVNLFWNKLTRVYLHTPSSLMYTGYGKMNNFFKIADSVRDHFLRKGQKLNQLVDYPKVQQTADDSDFKTFEGSKVQQTANNSNFKVFEDFTWGGLQMLMTLIFLRTLK